MSVRRNGKARGDSVLKTLPDALQEEIFQRLRRTTQPKVVAWLKEKHDLDTRNSALTEFWSWYQRSGSLKQAASFADQFKAQAAKIPEFKEDQAKLQAATQILFEIEAAKNRDPQLFLALRADRRAERSLSLAETKFRETIKSDIEKGLDALHVEIKGNAEALQLFERLKASVLKSVEGTK